MKNIKDKFKFNLQLFADEGEENSSEKEVKSSEITKNEEPDHEKTDEKLFTQEEVNKMISQRLERERKSGNKVQNNKEQVETKSTENDALKELQEEVRTMKLTNVALRNGVKDEDISKVLKLAEIEEGDTFEDKIKNVLEQFPFLSTNFNKEEKKEEKDGPFKGLEIEASKGTTGATKTVAEKMAEEANETQKEEQGLNPWN